MPNYAKHETTMPKALTDTLGWRKFGLEPLDNGVNHLTDEAKDDGNRFFVEDRITRIIEDYARGERALALDLRIWARGNDISEYADLRLLVQGLPREEFERAVGQDSAALHELELELRRDDSSCVYYPMFVGVRESVQDCKAVSRRVFPSVVWLELIEHRDVLLGDVTTHLGLLKPIGVDFKRELDLTSLGVRGVSSKMGNGQLPCDVVERRSKVLQAVTEANAPLDCRKLRSEGVKVDLSRLRLVVAPDGISVSAERPSKIFVQRLKVLERVIHFRSRTFKCDAHGDYPIMNGEARAA
jgi:hypothetical protein